MRTPWEAGVFVYRDDRILLKVHDEYRWATVDEAMSLLYWPEAREAARLATHLARST